MGGGMGTSCDRDMQLMRPARAVASTSSITAKTVGIVSTTRSFTIMAVVLVRTIRTHTTVASSPGEVTTRHAQSHSRKWWPTSSVVDDAITTTGDHPPPNTRARSRSPARFDFESDRSRTRSPHDSRTQKDQASSSTKPCHHFQKGDCWRGSECRFRHVLSGSSGNTDANTRERSRSLSREPRRDRRDSSRERRPWVCKGGCRQTGECNGMCPYCPLDCGHTKDRCRKYNNGNASPAPERWDWAKPCLRCNRTGHVP